MLVMMFCWLFSHCMLYVRKYYRYLFRCSVRLGVFVVEYAAKYEELSRFCPYINAEDAIVSKCVKFENGLRPEIYQYICFHEIRDFDTLVHKCHMFDDAGKAKLNYYKVVNDKKGNGGRGQEDQGEAEERRLDRFIRNKPLTFKGRFNAEGALTWMEGMERIFRATVTNDD